MGWKFYSADGSLLTKVPSAGTAETATVATTVTVTDNESTAENNVLVFVANAAATGGDVGLESDGTLHYNPSTGTVTATTFAGALTGNVTGDTSGSSGSTTGNAATVTVTDNENTAENNLITFVANAADATGSHGLEMDGDFHYNPNTGALTATSFTGAVTGTVTGSASQVTVTAVTDNDTVYPVFVTGSSGANDPEVATALTYNPSTGLLSAAGLTLSGDLTVNGTTTTVATTNTVVSDSLIELNNGAGSNANDSGIVIERGSTGNNAIFVWDESEDKFIVGTTTDTGASTGDLTIATGTLVANVEGNVTGNTSGSSGSTTGNAATATALASARTIGGVSFDGTGNIDLPGVNSAGNQATSGLAATATLAATVTVVDSTDTSSFVALFDSATGDLAAKTDAGLAYNSGTGTLTATAFDGPITGNVTGDASGSALTVTQAAQTAITSVGTLTGLAVSGSGAMSIVSTSTSAEGILLHANGGASETIKIHSDQGTGNDSIEILSDDGGISMDVADGKLIKLGGATVFDDEIQVDRDGSNHLTVDCTKGNKFNCNMNGTVANLYLTNPGATVSGNYMVRLVHSGGARTIDHYYHTGTVTKVHFAGGTKPTLTAATGAEDIMALYWDGASFHATMMLDSKEYT